MQTKAISGMKIVPPKSTSGDYETPANCPVMHQVLVCVGKRRSGKSVSVTSLIEQMKFDYCIVCAKLTTGKLSLMFEISYDAPVPSLSKLVANVTGGFEESVFPGRVQPAVVDITLASAH